MTTRSSLADRIGKWRRLPAEEKRWVIFAILIGLPAAWAALGLFGLGRIQHWLSAPLKLPRCDETSQEVERFARLLDLAAKHTWTPTTCLTRSLALVWFMKRRGIDIHLRIGARFFQGRLEAHAWTEWRGTPINDVERISEQFTAFAERLPSRSFLR